MQKKAIVLLAEGFEEIEAITIIDVLRRSGVGVDACGIDSLRVKGSRGINVFADIILKNVTGIYDACALPGGMPGAANLFADKRIRGMLLTQAKTDSGLIAAICSSPAVVLAPLGILDNKSATCYPGMESAFSKTTKYVDNDVVIDKNTITGKGPAAALKFALTLVNALCGQLTADKTAKSLLLR